MVLGNYATAALSPDKILSARLLRINNAGRSRSPQDNGKMPMRLATPLESVLRVAVWRGKAQAGQ